LNGRKVRQRKTPERFEGGVFEIALRHRGEAFRVVCAVRIGPDRLDQKVEVTVTMRQRPRAEAARAG
jgi:hypothetical protein